MKGKTTTTSHPRRGVIHWVVWMIVALLFILTGTLVFFTQAPGEKLLANLLERQLRDVIQQNVQIGALETNLFSRLQILDLHIHTTNDVDSTDFLYLKSCTVKYQVITLLSGKLVIESVDLSDLRVNILRDSAGTSNLPQFPASGETDSSKQPPAIQLELRQLNLCDGHVFFTDCTGEIPSAKIHNLQALISLEQDSIYHFQVQIDTNRIEYRNSVIDIRDLLLIGAYSGSTVSVDTLQFYPPGMALTGTGSAVLSADGSPLNAKLQIQGDPSELTDILSPLLPKGLSPVRGEFNLNLELSGNVSNPELNVHLYSPSLALADLILDSLNLDAEYSDHTCEIKELSVRTFKGQFGLAGTLKLDSLYSFYLNSSVSRADLASIWRFLYWGKSPYRGRLEGHLRAQGNLKNYKQTTLDANVRLSDVRYRERRIDNFEAVVGVEGGAARFRFTGEGARADAALRIVGRSLSGEFAANFEQLNPVAGFLNLPSLKGTLRVSGDISGSMDTPVIDARIEADQIRYQNIPINSLRSRLYVRDRELTIDELAFSGGLTVTDSTQLPFNAKDLTGSIAYSGLLRGNLENLQGDMTITLEEPGYQTIRFDEGMAHLVLSGQKIKLSPLELTRDTLRIQLEADFDLGTYTGTGNLFLFRQERRLEHRTLGGTSPLDTLLRSDLKYDIAGLNQISLLGDLNVENVAFLSAFLPKHPEIGGALQLQIKVSGVPVNPKGEARFNLQKAQLGTAQLDSIRGMVTMEADQIAVPSIELFLKNHKSWIATYVDFVQNEDRKPMISRESAIRGEAYGDNFPLAAINPFLPDGFVLNGTSSYNLSWEGTIGNILPAGTIRIDSGRVNWGVDKPEFHDLFLNLTLQPNAVEVNRLDGFLGTIPFNLDAVITTPDRRAFDLDIELRISDIGLFQTRGTVSQENIAINSKSQQLNLKSIQPFFPSIPKIEGILNTEITINGPPLDPQVDGFIDIRDLALQPPPLIQPLSGGVVKLRFDRNNVYIDSLFFRIGQGWILSQGTLVHDDRILKRIDLTTNLRNIEYEQPRQWNLSIKSADLHYHGEADNYYLEGDVLLGKSKVLVNFQPQALLPFARSVERPTPELPGFITRTQFDIRIRDSKEVWIDNNIARLRIHPEIEIIGSPTQVNLAGRLAIEEGYVLFLDRKFKMTRGIIDFIDPDRINPIVDIQAETTVRNYQALEATPYDIALKISGPMDQLIVELTSDPPLERSDIVSLLTLGATREQLTGTSLERDDPSKTDILVDRAGELSSRKVSGYISKNLASVTGLDDVSIEGNLFRFGKSWGPRLVASKRITDRMEVTYMTNVGHFNEKNVRIDYRLSKYFWIESETDQRGKAGLDLKYKIKLK